MVLKGLTCKIIKAFNGIKINLQKLIKREIYQVKVIRKLMKYFKENLENRIQKLTCRL